MKNEIKMALGTTYELLKARKLDDAADIIRNNPIVINEIYPHDDHLYDIWDVAGLQSLPCEWKIYIHVPPDTFVRLEQMLSQIEKQINEDLQNALRHRISDSFSVEIVPHKKNQSECRFASFQLAWQSISYALEKSNGLLMDFDLDKIKEMEESINTKPGNAVLIARTLIEGFAKSIRDYPSFLEGEAVKNNENPGDTIKRIISSLKENKLNTHTGEILETLSSLSKKLAGLRNNCSSSHAGNETPQPRHAQLAAISAIAFITFISEEIIDQKSA